MPTVGSQHDRSRQFPYQFLAAYLNASDEVPQKIKAAFLADDGGRFVAEVEKVEL